MDLDLELKYIPGEHIPRADALSRMDFDENESDNDRARFSINNIYFDHSDLATQAKVETDIGTNRFCQEIMKRTKSGNWKRCSEAEKDLNNKNIH